MKKGTMPRSLIRALLAWALLISGFLTVLSRFEIGLLLIGAALVVNERPKKIWKCGHCETFQARL